MARLLEQQNVALHRPKLSYIPAKVTLQAPWLSSRDEKQLTQFLKKESSSSNVISHVPVSSVCHVQFMMATKRQIHGQTDVPIGRRQTIVLPTQTDSRAITFVFSDEYHVLKIAGTRTRRLLSMLSLS